MRRNYAIVIILAASQSLFPDPARAEADRSPPSEQALEWADAEFDTGQWIRAIKTGGTNFDALTAKHDNGFCLWPRDFLTVTSVEPVSELADDMRDGRGSRE